MTEEWGGAEPARVRRLERRSHGRLLAGVASGLADYTGVPTLVIRILFVILAFTGGAGIVLYIAGWLLIPERGEPESIAQAIARSVFSGSPRIGALFLLGIALVVLGASLVATHTLFVERSVVWGLALIALGLLVFYGAEAQRGGTPGPGSWGAAPGDGAPATGAPPPAPPEAAAGAAPVAVAATTATLPPLEIPTAPDARTAARTTPRVRTRRERSVWGWFVVGLALATTGLLAVADQVGIVSPHPVVYPALAMTILGVGLLASAWFGRARWLIALCLLLILPTAALSMVHVPFRGGFGQRSYAPATAADVAAPYRLIAGQMTIDLSGLTGESPAPVVTASVVAGHIRVLVPASVPVDVSGTVAAGTATVFGSTTSGRNVSLQGIPGSSVQVPAVVLHLYVSYGAVTVERPSAFAGAAPAAPAKPQAPGP